MTWPIALLLAVLGIATSAAYMSRVLASLGRLQIERERDLKRAALEDVPRLREDVDAMRARVVNLGDQVDAILSRKR